MHRPTTRNYTADSYQKNNSHHAACITKEIWVTRGQQAIMVPSPLVISVASLPCLSNKTQTPSNLSFAQQGNDAMADLPSLFSQNCLQPVLWDFYWLNIAFWAVMIMTLVDLQMAKWVMLKLIISYGIPAESAWCFPGTSSSAYAGLFHKLLDLHQTFFFSPFL